jgi:hypothetical protein
MADGMFSTVLKKSKSKLPTEWEKFLQPGTAQYEAAVLLNSQGNLPKITKAKTGDYSIRGYFDKDTNTVVIADHLEDKNVPELLAHELTHALTTSMQNSARDIRTKSETQAISPTDKRFMDAWSKLDPDLSKTPKFATDSPLFDSYRHSFREAPAWAVGRMEDPRKSMTRAQNIMSGYGGSHRDPTLAQEQAILRDLQARKIREEQEPSSNSWWKDPFAPTVN